MKEIPDTKAYRSKYWPELTDSEKIERMREVVKTMQNLLKKMNKELQNVMNHSHRDDGEMVVPVKHMYSMSEDQERAKESREVYF